MATVKIYGCWKNPSLEQKPRNTHPHICVYGDRPSSHLRYELATLAVNEWVWFYSRGACGCLPRCFIDTIIWEKNWLLSITGWIGLGTHGDGEDDLARVPARALGLAIRADFMCKWQCWSMSMAKSAAACLVHRHMHAHAQMHWDGRQLTPGGFGHKC